MSEIEVTAFAIAVPEEDLVDLRERLRRTRWPRPWPEPRWAAGSDEATLRRLVASWADGFDGRAQERRLNEEPQWIATIDGQRLHFLHVRADAPTGLPLILTHGWPSAAATSRPTRSRTSWPPICTTSPADR